VYVCGVTRGGTLGTRTMVCQIDGARAAFGTWTAVQVSKLLARRPNHPQLSAGTETTNRSELLRPAGRVGAAVVDSCPVALALRRRGLNMATRLGRGYRSGTSTGPTGSGTSQKLLRPIELPWLEQARSASTRRTNDDSARYKRNGMEPAHPVQSVRQPVTLTGAATAFLSH
jgi:hypothetical protein